MVPNIYLMWNTLLFLPSHFLSILFWFWPVCIVLKYFFLWKHYSYEKFLLPMCAFHFFFLLWFVNAGPNQHYNSSAGPMAAPTRSNCALRAKQEHREPSPICCSTEGMVVGSRRHGFAALWARSTKNVKKPERQMCEPCRIARFKTFAKQNRNLFSFSPTFDS